MNIECFQTGIERLLEQPNPLPSQKVGLVSHDAARLCDGRTAAEALHHRIGVRLKALFGPEHGFSVNNAPGAPVQHARHPCWNIPVWSLYGQHRKPDPAMLGGIDHLIIDLNTLPFRPYTYLATLRNVMQAAGEAGIPVTIADRPAPLPDTLDGAMPDIDQRGFVCPVDLPMAYAMTPGETALWLQSLPGIHPPEVHISAMTGYHRETRRQQGWPPWTPPSPAITSWEAAECYLITLFCEALPLFGNDRNGPLSFQTLYAADEWSDCIRLLQETLDGKAGIGIAATRQPLNAKSHGVRIVARDPSLLKPAQAAVYILWCAQQTMGVERLWHHAGAREDFFDQLFGARKVREQLQNGYPPDAVIDGWQCALSAFEQTRAACLLYTARTDKEQA